MKKILYYTVEKQTQTLDTIEECTGWKIIQTYKINDNKIIYLGEFEIRNDENTEEGIQIWLDEIDNKEEYEFYYL